jgi:TPR repeat protein
MVKFLKKNFKINARNKSFEETQNILHEKLKNSGKLNYKLALDYRNFKFTKLKLKSEPFKFYHKEFIYFKKAADLDHDKSQVIIAEFYKSGTHVPMSYKDSFNYYKKAALQNNVEAMANLGIMYKFAYGTKEDEDNTKFWLEKASKMGSLDAKFYLAKMYQEGYVVEKDLEKSLKIYKEIADSKESPTFTKSISTLLTAIFYYNGYDFDPNPKVSARPEFYQRRPVQGYVPFEMSFSLSDKLNSKEAILKALNYYNKSASKGNKTSIVAIANIYEHGTGVKKNLQLARSLYLIANNMSSQDAGESRVRSVMTQKEVENSTQVGIKLWNGMVLHNRKELYRIKGEAAFIN